MKYSGLFFLMVIITITSCEKADKIDELSLNGTYKGTFQRIVGGSGQISNVVISFSGNNWQGNSQFSKYPALCNGIYVLEDDKINFENQCPWTAEFDSTLILSGKYQLKAYSDTLELFRNTASYKDVYLLTREDSK